jgi:hypothetical protein
MGIIPYSPLAGGWLSGRHTRENTADPTSAARPQDRFDISVEANQRKLDAATALKDLADELGGAGDLAALQPAVVVGADAGQGRDLLATEPRDAALPVAREPGRLGRDVGPPGGEELGDVLGGVHGPGPSLCGSSPTVETPRQR